MRSKQQSFHSSEGVTATAAAQTLPWTSLQSLERKETARATEWRPMATKSARCPRVISVVVFDDDDDDDDGGDGAGPPPFAAPLPLPLLPLPPLSSSRVGRRGVAGSVTR